MLNIKKIGCRIFRYQLETPVGGSGVGSVDVLIADVELDTGISGFGFSYVLAGPGTVALAASQVIAETVLTGNSFVHPEHAWRKMVASCNRSGRGPNFLAIAALDVALWDAYAKVLELPLGSAMGGAPRSVPVYGSSGFGPNKSVEAVIDQVMQYAEKGYSLVKLRSSGNQKDRIDLRKIVSALPEGMSFAVDLNEKCTLSQARRMMADVLDLGGVFVEEPLPASDLNGYRTLSAAFPGAIATGEHLQGLAEANPFLTERLCAMFQPDVAMIGGLTEALRVARVAEAMGIEISPHFLPGLFIHLAAACPNVTWLEEFSLLEPMFDGLPCVDNNGQMSLPKTRGHGITLAQEIDALTTRVG